MFARRVSIALLAAVLTAAAASAPVASAAPKGGPFIGTHSLRAPVTDETFYFVMADRFANGSSANDTGGISGARLQHGFDPTHRGFYNGGDLQGLLGQIDYIEGLGTTSIWLTPSFKNKAVQQEDGPSAGYHGYWVTDFTQIDPHLGTNAELRALVDEAHERGMKVYFDIITNHTADVIGYQEGARTAYVPKDEKPYRTASGTPFDDRDYAGTGNFPPLDPAESFPYTPVFDPGEQDLKVPSWLNDTTLYHNRGNTTFTGEDSYYGDFFGLDDLFTEHPTVVDGMIDIYKTWIRDLGIDGFRIDTMKHVNDEFWQKFGPEVLAYAKSQGKDEFFMFGEVFDLSSRPFTSTFTTRNQMQAVLDFPFQDAARNFASKSQPTRQLSTFFRNDDWYTDADSNVYQLPTFLGNHDMGRIGFFVKDDNKDAPEDELLARDRLAHELMYFSRGNPVIYYGDEQGFTGTGGDQVARQTMFASQVPEYLDDDLLGTDSTHSQDNFNTNHQLYQRIKKLADLAKAHPALRDGAHQDRYSTDQAGIYAFSRLDRGQQREYVVALNNSESETTADIPTYVGNGNFVKVYGSGPEQLTSNGDQLLTVTVPALSTVVYRSAEIPRSDAAPNISIDNPTVSGETNSRMLVSANVGGSSFNEVTFYAKVGGGKWTPIGTDDTRPYRVFHDVSSIPDGTEVTYRAVVVDNAGHQRLSSARPAVVPAPKLTIESPTEGAGVFGTIEIRATADPERASHEVRIQRKLPTDSDWVTLNTDDSSPVYTHYDNLSTVPVGTQIQYRAVLNEPDGTQVISPIRTVTRTAPTPLVNSVTVAGSLQSEVGCSDDWLPDCAASHLTFTATNGGVWEATFEIPAGNYEYKVAIDDSWAVNYGAGGARDGANITLSLPTATNVTFVWDQVSHIVTHTTN
jgi:alpha-amylase